MKLHSSKLTEEDIRRALRQAQANGQIADDVFMVEFVASGSRSRARSWAIQLGALDKGSGPTKSRHYKNSGVGEINRSIWAASYDEWGWFIAQLFAVDPDATFGPYLGLDSFNAQTASKYVLATRHEYDTHSSASRQHYIDTGKYLPEN